MAKCLQHSFLVCHVVVILGVLATFAHGQSISTSTPVPPLQWINLTGLLTGSGPPPLKGVSLGYDNTSRNLLIFGGESEGGFVQSDTYLLNLDSLAWTKPSSPANLQGSPPARSAAVSGDDFAANSRRAHVLIGGTNGQSALSDVWEFDYNNQFWSQVNISPGGPSARWGASGGIDIQVAYVPDATIAGPNNTVYIAGGTASSGPISLSDIWKLHLSGTLSSNLPNSAFGSWEHVPIGKLPGFVDQAGTVVGGQVIAAGGCNTTSASNSSCAQQSSFVLNTATNSDISPGSCTAPRFGGALAQNFNSFSSSFSSQVFLLLGTFDGSKWNDGGGLSKGEVAVLDINAGTWSRVLPSGDPGQNGKAAFPSPRQGAAVLSSSTTLVGSTRTIASDTIVFGGQDASNNYLNEIWLLRAYNDALTSSNQKWTGYGNGQLQSGVNANGAGVIVQYMTQCASAIGSPSSSTSPTSTSPPSVSSSPVSSSQMLRVPITHTALAPLSVALLLPAVIFVRLASPSSPSSGGHKALLIMSASVAVVAYALGLTGLVTSFTSISSTSVVQKRSSSGLTLKTGHGQAGLALFVALYGLIPVLFLLRKGRILHLSSFFTNKHPSGDRSQSPSNSIGMVEKPSSMDTDAVNAASSSFGHSHPVTTPQTPQRRSWPGHLLWPGSRTRERTESLGTVGTESSSNSIAPDTSTAPTQPSRGFEVVNRPQRVRKPSTNASHYSRRSALRDVDWLERRRSLNAVGELDYALSQISRAREPPTPAIHDVQSTLGLMPLQPEPTLSPKMPPWLDGVLHTVLQMLILAICILCLIALWSLKTRAGFVIFIIWTAIFYAALFVCSWYGRPHQSILTVIIYRLLASPVAPPAPAQPTPSPRPLSSPGLDQYPFPTGGPYIHHQPPFHTTGTDDVSTSYGARSAEGEDDDDDEDEDTRQQRIEDEMARRDVSIVTVPRRKLWIANPEMANAT